MKLSEKIYYCRKKSGKSQETLAEELGVSRQAVSKWETGEAEPEIGKLKRLAEIFGVTADWLLSDEEAAKEQAPGPEAAVQTGTGQSSSGPGTFGVLLRRYGWLAGVYQALAGAAMAAVGATVYLFSPRVEPFNQVANRNLLSDLATDNATDVVCIITTAGGILLIVFGVVRAVVLRKRNKGE